MTFRGPARRADPPSRAALAAGAVAAALACLLWPAACAAAPVRVAVTADNSIVLVDGEWHLNAGRQGRIRIKGNQHLVALKFDTAPLRGRLIKSAVLVARQADHAIDGLTISTIAADWDETRSSALTSGVLPQEGWAWPGARFPAVTGTNSYSIACQAPSVLKDGAYHWTVAPDLVHACVVGAAYGLALHEWRVDYSRNPTIFSREQGGKEPYLLVEFAPSDGRASEPAPEPPADLRVTGDEPADLRLRLRAPRAGFAYEVTVGGRPLPRWNTPLVDPGAEQAIPIRDLPLRPRERVEIAVVTVNRLGERSRAAALTAAVPEARPPVTPSVPALAPGKAAHEGLAVLPLLDRYDADGRPVGDLPRDYPSRNAVFDGRTIRLAAARGEVVGFQVLLKGKGAATVACEVGGLRTEMHRGLYVESPRGRIPDPLVPCERLDLSEKQATPVCVDVYVPFDAPAGRVGGEFRVSDGRRAPIELVVRRFAIPREASFLCEMNSYGLPERASEFYRLQEIAYDHRCHVNILHYGHTTAAPGARKCRMDMIMADGRRMDERRYSDVAPGAKAGYWDDFAKVFGPFLSGSHFKDGHRGPVSAPGFYLTFHESWPLNVRAFWSGSPDAYETFAARPVYAETWTNLLSDFVRVAERRGWTRTGFQIYLNNKGSLDDPRRSPWILDEPAAYWDYRALAYYGGLVKRGRGGRCPVTLRYRIDISRPEFDRGQLWGAADLWVVSTGAMRQYRRLVADRAERTGELVWVYGSTSKVEEPSRATAAWALESYLAGARGLVPWQTINRDGSALRKADALGLFIFEPAGDAPATIHHSLRLKAYREAEQLIEYLELLRQKRNLTAGQVRQFVEHYAGGDEAASPEGWRRLREAAAGLLD